MTSLDATGISRLLHALDEELAARGTTADVYLVGGAAIALSFDATRTTRDLDAVFVPTTQVRAAAEGREVAPLGGR
jgi:methylmalonyl-CoA mutase cobalamin-binding subunit